MKQHSSQSTSNQVCCYYFYYNFILFYVIQICTDIKLVSKSHAVYIYFNAFAYIFNMSVFISLLELDY
jgi:hypothetical protein